MADEEGLKLICTGGSVVETEWRPRRRWQGAAALWLAGILAGLYSERAGSAPAGLAAAVLWGVSAVMLARPLLFPVPRTPLRPWRNHPRDLWLRDGSLQLAPEEGGHLVHRDELLAGHLERAVPGRSFHTLVLTTRDGVQYQLLMPGRRQAEALLRALGLEVARRRVVFSLPGPRSRLVPLAVLTMAALVSCVMLLGSCSYEASGYATEPAASWYYLPALRAGIARALGAGALSAAPWPAVLGVYGGLAGFAGVPMLLVLSLMSWRQPRRVSVGHDGLSVEGEIPFLPWAAVARPRRSADGLQMVMRHGGPLEIALPPGGLPTNREGSIREARAGLREALLRAVQEARRASAVEPTTAAAVRAFLRQQASAPLPSAAGQGPYRQGPDEGELWRILHDGCARAEARVAAARALATSPDPATQERLRLARDVLVEPSVREALAGLVTDPSPSTGRGTRGRM